MSVTYTDIANAKKESAELRAMLRQDLKAARAKVRDLKAQVDAKVRDLKAQVDASKAEDRAAMQTKALADGGKRHGAYVVRESGKRFTMIPDDPAVPVTKGERTLLAAILTGIKVG